MSAETGFSHKVATSYKLVQNRTLAIIPDSKLYFCFLLQGHVISICDMQVLHMKFT